MNKKNINRKNYFYVFFNENIDDFEYRGSLLNQFCTLKNQGGDTF